MVSEGIREPGFVTEVRVEDGLAYAGLLRDVVHGHIGAIALDDAYGGLEEIPATLVAFGGVLGSAALRPSPFVAHGYRW